MAANKENEDKNKNKPPKEVIHDDGFFIHDTDDTYEGGFEIRKKEKVIKMNGQGTYTTCEGDTYEGVWDSDRLAAGATVTYVDGSQYIGNLKDWSYAGNGKYVYPDKSMLECEFADNCPVRNLKLTDPNDHTWLGHAQHGFAWLDPVNHFYEMLDKTKDHPAEKSSKRLVRERSPGRSVGEKSPKDAVAEIPNETNAKTTLSPKPK